MTAMIEPRPSDRDTRYTRQHNAKMPLERVLLDGGLGSPTAATLDDLFGYFVARRIQPIGMVVMAPTNQSLP